MNLLCFKENSHQNIKTYEFCNSMYYRNSMIDEFMLDLGSSINIMPNSIYTSLDLGPLKPIRITVQLANSSVV